MFACCHIKALHGRIVYDALGYPAVEAQIDTSKQLSFFAIVTSRQFEYHDSSYTSNRNSSLRSSVATTPEEACKTERLSSFEKPNPNMQQSLQGNRHSSVQRNSSTEADASHHAEWLRSRIVAETAVDIINTNIQPAMLAQRLDCVKQAQIDQFLTDFVERQETSNEDTSLALSTATMAISMAACRAGAHAQHNLPLYFYLSQLAGTAEPQKFFLPVPHIALFGGGARAGGRLKSIACRSISILPTGCSSFHEATALGIALFHSITGQRTPFSKNKNISTTDEGTIVPQNSGMEDILQVLTSEILPQVTFTYKTVLKFYARSHIEAYQKLQTTTLPSYKLSLHIDADSFYNHAKQKYHLESSIRRPSASIILPSIDTATANGTPVPLSPVLTAEELFNHIRDLLRVYPITSLIDPFSTTDLQAWKNAVMEINITLPSTLDIVGDRLIASQPLNANKFVVLNRYCNAVLFRVNQVSTVTELVQLVQILRNSGASPVAAQARHESEDTFICDAAVGFGCKQIKLGAPVRGENIAKYNRLMAIEDEILNSEKFTCVYAGTNFS